MKLLTGFEEYTILLYVLISEHNKQYVSNIGLIKIFRFLLNRFLIATIYFEVELQVFLMLVYIKKSILTACEKYTWLVINNKILSI